MKQKDLFTAALSVAAAALIVLGVRAGTVGLAAKNAQAELDAAIAFVLPESKTFSPEPYDGTDEAIRAGFAALRPASRYDALYQSARCRSEADWLVGMNASRAFTLRYGTLLSVGRVQTPTLAMLVTRRLEIDRFVPQPYWTVQADFGDYQGMWFDPSREDGKRIPSEAAARAIADKVRGKPARVTGVKAEEKRELAPQLYDLTTLQREASSQLGFSAERTLKTAQSLYEKRKLITYPRTDSRYLSHDMGGSVEKALKNLPESYAALSAPVLAGPIPRIKRVFDDTKLTDHHAIIPTGRRADPQALSPDEAKLFDLIARRLIAAFYPPCRYQAVRVATESEGERFASTGTTVLEEGFRAVYRDIRREQREEAPLPRLGEGDARTVRGAHVKSDKTKPPREHTDASLLAQMEHAGRVIEDEALREQMKGCSLGTPATRAAIIERLIDVGYARRKGRQILATEKGVRLIEAVPPEIASPETTGRWEQALPCLWLERRKRAVRRNAPHRKRKNRRIIRITAIPNGTSRKRTAKAFIIPKVIMRRLPVR